MSTAPVRVTRTGISKIVSRDINYGIKKQIKIIYIDKLNIQKNHQITKKTKWEKQRQIVRKTTWIFGRS